MWWECGECGAHVARERAPALCAECGRAGASFVRVDPGLDADASLGCAREAWLRAGVESGTFRMYGDVTWADAS